MEGFFLACLQVDIQAVEFACRTYGNSLNSLDFAFGVEILMEGLKAEKRAKYWGLYCHVFPTMTEETFVSFDDFIKDMTAPPEKKATSAEILDKTEKILNMKFKKGGL